MSLDFIIKVSSKDNDTQAYLYTQQFKNLSNIEQITTDITCMVLASSYICSTPPTNCFSEVIIF